MAASSVVTLTSNVPAVLASLLGLTGSNAQTGAVLTLPSRDAVALVTASVARFGSAAEDAAETPTQSDGTLSAAEMATLGATFGRPFNVRAYGAKLDGTTDDAAAIRAAFTAMKAGGTHAAGALVIDGPCRIASPIVLDGGYANVPGDPVTFNGTPAFQLQVSGHLIPAAGIGTAVTVSGFYGAVVDARFKGGGNTTDVALHCENLIGLDLAVHAENFAGIVLHADATGGATKRIRRSTIRRVYADGCGQAVYWKWMEAFGTFQDVFDNGSVNGSYFGFCADTGITKWENFSPATQAYGVLFESCNSMNIDVISLGDRPTEALLKITGNVGGVSSDFGRINQIRVSGQPFTGGQVDPVLPAGVKIVDVSSISIDNVQTFRCVKGVHAIGSNVAIKRHHSLTSDTNPLYVEGDAFNAAPNVTVQAGYRFHRGASVFVASSVTGGLVKVNGYTETMWMAGTTSQYAIDCQSAGVTLDLVGLTVLPRAGLAGYVNPIAAGLVGSQTTVGPSGAYIYFQPPAPRPVALAVGAAQTVVSNTTTATTVAGPYTVPANSVLAGTTYRLKAWGTVDNDAAATVTLRCRLGGPTGTSVALPMAITSATAKTAQGWNIDYILTFRAAASAATPVSVGGQGYNTTANGTQSQGGVATNVNMTVARDLVIDATWSAATATNVIRCEGFTVEKVA